MLYSPEFVAPHVVSVLGSALLLLAALRRPVLARVLLTLLFLGASVVNSRTALTTPDVYLSYAPLAIFAEYREIILGPFARHLTLIVLSIAVCQAAMGAGLILGGIFARVALLGAIVFLVDIAPLGVGSAFPATLLMAAAAAVLLSRTRRPSLERSLWKALLAPRTHGAAA